ncbi:hypothetical protein GYMLUDRAFT_994997 [Collybiopsis luxurians FD-317 M1]|uniref:DUF6533 domain-containing protein n=1 Tax=Collybiopsis luxurians FD-317 M1 TaxID=944289 RepID=A0A0D0BEL0_9AGAR|nr:hypothetical protein GYMLUDRAFT_994997 [Collybiopsis luxurians FD-317 M1]
MLTKTATYQDLISTLVSTSTLLIYDYCLTLDLECKLVWSRPLKWFNILYLVQRYLPFIDTVVMLNIGTFSSNHSQIYCYSVLHGSLFILSLRIWAISRDRIRNLAYIISGSFILLWGAIIAIVFIFRSKHNFDSHQSLDPLARNCVHAQPAISSTVTFGLLMLYQLGGFVLLVLYAIPQYKDRKHSHLYNPVYRDGIFQYVLMLALLSVDIFVMEFISADLDFLFMPLIRVLHSVTTSRIVLHIHEAMNKSEVYSIDQSTSIGISSILRDPVFASGPARSDE